METKRKINVVVVGLQFGAEFPLIYRDHPNVGNVAICDKNESLLNEYGDKFGIEHRFTKLDDVLASSEIDAVHLVTPIHMHASQSIDVLNSGKHCACTVPMATSLEELQAIVEAQHRSQKNYMMMETSVYTRQFLLAKEMHEKGEFGRIQLLRGAHYQDMENWPEYWMGLPPMHYATHAVSPLLALTNSRAVRVICYGSGKMREELTVQYNNPFPVEIAVVELEDRETCAEITRTLFHTARDYLESFSVYGELASLEWQREREPLVMYKMGPLESHRGREIISSSVTPPDFEHLLPPQIARYTSQHVQVDENNPHRSFIQGGGHHGSHPHMVHEFVMSIVEQRKPWIDAMTAANWTAVGICAHSSAMQHGTPIDVPLFSI